MNITTLDSGIVPFSSERLQWSTPRVMDPSNKVSSRNVSIHNSDARLQPITNSMDPGAQSCCCSKSIPISKNMTRTQSELQLVEDEAMADFRDYSMYTRIVNGINSKDQHHGGSVSNDNEIVNNIIRTRHLPVRDFDNFLRDQYWREENITANSFHKAWPVSSQSCPVHTEDPEDEEIFVLDM